MEAEDTGILVVNFNKNKNKLTVFINNIVILEIIVYTEQSTYCDT